MFYCFTTKNISMIKRTIWKIKSKKVNILLLHFKYFFWRQKIDVIKNYNFLSSLLLAMPDKSIADFNHIKSVKIE